MKTRTLVGAALLLGLLLVGVTAFAYGPGFHGGPGMMGRGMMGSGMMGQGMMGGGPGHMMGAWQGPGQGFDKETTETMNQLHQKRLELSTLLAGPEVDEAKAKALQTEINTLHDKLSESRLAAALEFRKNNPDAAQGYGFGPGPRW